jgi:hypothetical protein
MGLRRQRRTKEGTMTLCPVAILAGCSKCPAFKVCPLKGVIGDYREPDSAPAKPPEGGGKQ